MVKNLSMYVGPHDVYPTVEVNFSILAFWQENAKIKSLSIIFSLQTLFCYQCVELYNYYRAQTCVISPNFNQLGLRPRRYHARFSAIMVKYLYRRTDYVMENLSNAMLPPSHARITENIFAKMFNLALSCLDTAKNAPVIIKNHSRWLVNRLTKIEIKCEAKNIEYSW